MEEKNEWMYELHIHIRAESCKSELHQKIVKLNCKKILQNFFLHFRFSIFIDAIHFYMIRAAAQSLLRKKCNSRHRGQYIPNNFISLFYKIFSTFPKYGII